MKTCNKCKKEKPREEFSKCLALKDGLQRECKTCRAIFANTHYKKNSSKYKLRAKKNLKKWLKEFRLLKEAKPCKDCGIKYPYYVMDFDHVESDKVEHVSVLARGGYRKRTLKEIEKCDLVCSNCHRIRTHDRLSKL